MNAQDPENFKLTHYRGTTGWNQTIAISRQPRAQPASALFGHWRLVGAVYLAFGNSVKVITCAA